MFLHQKILLYFASKYFSKMARKHRKETGKGNREQQSDQRTWNRDREREREHRACHMGHVTHTRDR